MSNDRDMTEKTTNYRVLTVFSLVMISVTAVDSLRSLAISAEYGFSLVFYYFASAIVFFIPTALVSAELATGWPENGGIYVWVREAFGVKTGFLTIWLQWIYNIFWYPTMLSLMAATIAYPFNPEWVRNPYYMLVIVLTLFWAATIVNCFGMKFSARVINTATVFGTLVPIIFIIFLGILWVLLDQPMHFDVSWHSFWPDLSDLKNLVLLTAILYGLIGMELPAMHAQEAKDPKRDYPKVMLIGGFIILSTLILGSLAVAAVVPHHKLELLDGLLQAFRIFFQSFHMSWLMPVVAFMILVGALGGITVWIIGPTKGLMVAARDGALPPLFARVNRHLAPVPMLILQGIIFTVICSVFVLLPTVNSSFWLLTDISAQLALLVYVFMFLAAIKLKFSRQDVIRTFNVPGGKPGMAIVCLLGLSSSLFAIFIGFLPPKQVPMHSTPVYILFLIVGIALACALPLLIYRYRKPSWRQPSPFHVDRF